MSGDESGCGSIHRTSIAGAATRLAKLDACLSTTPAERRMRAHDAPPLRDADAARSKPSSMRCGPSPASSRRPRRSYRRDLRRIRALARRRRRRAGRRGSRDAVRLLRAGARATVIRRAATRACCRRCARSSRSLLRRGDRERRSDRVAGTAEAAALAAQGLGGSARSRRCSRRRTSTRRRACAIARCSN